MVEMLVKLWKVSLEIYSTKYRMVLRLNWTWESSVWNIVK